MASRATTNKEASRRVHIEETNKEAKTLLRQAEQLLDAELQPKLADRRAWEALECFRQSGDQEGIADALRAVLHCMRYFENLKEACRLCTEEMELFRRRGNRSGEAKMMVSFAEINYTKRGHKYRHQALQHAAKARSIFQELDDRRMEVFALIALTNAEIKTLEKQGVTTEGAREILENATAARKLARTVNDDKLQAIALHVLTTARVICKDFEAALESHEETLAIYRRLGYRKSEAFTLQSMACWRLDNRQPEEACKLAEKSASIYKEIAEQGNCEAVHEAVSMQCVVQAYSALGRHAEAVSTASQTRERFRKATESQAEALMFESLLVAYFVAGDSEEALVVAEELVTFYHKTKEQKKEGEALLTVARFQLQKKRLNRAVQACSKALKIFQDLNDSALQGYCLEIQGQIHIAQDKHAKALQAAQQERGVYKEHKDKVGEGVAVLHMCNVLMARGETEAIVPLATESVELFKQAGDRNRSSQTLSLLADILFQRKDYEQSLSFAVEAKALARGTHSLETETLLACAILRTNLILLAAATKTSAEAKDKAMRAAKEALFLCKELGKSEVLALALMSASQIYMIVGRINDAQVTADQAIPLLEEQNDKTNQGFALTLAAQAHVLGRRSQKAKERLEEAMAVYSSIDDQKGFAAAQDILAHLEGGMAPALPAGPVVTRERRASIDRVEIQQSVRQDIVPALGVDLVKVQVEKVTQMIIGITDHIEEDSPLLNIGLTSMSSAMLRDALARDFPGIELPFTLAFDYPTIKSVTNLLVEGAGALVQ